MKRHRMMYDIIPRHQLYLEKDYSKMPLPKVPVDASKELIALTSFSLVTAIILAYLIITTSGSVIAGWQ